MKCLGSESLCGVAYFLAALSLIYLLATVKAY